MMCQTEMSLSLHIFIGAEQKCSYLTKCIGAITEFIGAEHKWPHHITILIMPKINVKIITKQIKQMKKARTATLPCLIFLPDLSNKRIPKVGENKIVRKC